MTQVKCGKKLGLYENDICYKDVGHEGKCHKSPGHEAEALIQEVLAECGCRVVKATIHEDHKRKIDFWIFGQEFEKVNGGNEFLPIQFTIDFQAACGLKGREAIINGVIIVCIKKDELFEWEKSKDLSLREKIYKEFCATVYKVAQAFPSMHFARPLTKLVRFENTR